jgi:2'-5' RNA ligase
MKLCEVASTKGTYAGVKFSGDTSRSIKKFCEEHSIPNAVDPKSLHLTLLYSRKHCPEYDPIVKYDTPIIGKFKAWNVWETSPTEGPKTNCLIMQLVCPEMEKRHKELMEELKATFDYDQYQPHITLSYDIGEEFDTDALPPFKEPVTITGEYMEELDLDWAKNHTSEKDDSA